VSAYTLKGSDDAIHRIKENDPLGASEIIIDLNKESELFEMLDLSEDDIWFYNAVNSSYSDYEYFDSYQIKEDFLQGYIIYGDLNDENIETLKKIAEIIIPNEDFNLEDEDYRVKLSKTLYELFDNEIDYILGDYEVEKNREVSITVRESIDSELVNFFENLGFSFYSKHDMLSTTVGNLVMWARRLDIGKTDLISLLKSIFSYVDTGRLGGWFESQYEYQNIQNFDSESFNNYTGTKLEQIIEKIENSEEFGGEEVIQEFLKLRQRVTKNFKVDKWYKLPADKSIDFKITGFDINDMRILVTLNKQFKTAKQIKVSEETFNNLLYQPQLFDLFEN
jgi:hypothetical protein